MDIFELKIDAEVFRKTNDAWNRLQLNSPWSVGYVSDLVTNLPFETKEEWELYYYESGELRKKLLADLNMDLRGYLEDHTLANSRPQIVKDMDENNRCLNLKMGRTKDDLMAKAYMLKMEMDKLGEDISVDECKEAVRFRTICETWNGIRHTEENTIGVLRKEYPSIRFESTAGDLDYKYAVDYEAYLGDSKIMGIQIKPASYGGDAPYLQRARAGNQQKFDLYKKDFNIPVVTLMAKKDGGIVGNRHHMVLSMIFNGYQQLLDGEHDLI